MDSNSKGVSTPLLKPNKDRDFLTHFESYHTKRDNVDKLLKIFCCASKIALSSSLLPSPLLPQILRIQGQPLPQGLPPRQIHLGPQPPPRPPPHLPPLPPCLWWRRPLLLHRTAGVAPQDRPHRPHALAISAEDQRVGRAR
ncbi:hypothetical protein MRB53_021368 [Persea americana]|uniref:Uncharacterized protein n=1 Tax=Persea americana TaxID=3435 RepID=A0ACC2L3E7_PERAE|nr:hypothetical protein MRB53_021368 [Persea americana]